MMHWKKRYLNPYWLCQIIGWSTMVLIEMVNYTFFIVGKFSSRVLYVFLLCAIVGLLLTHSYRYFIRKRNLFNAATSYVWLFAFFSTFIISFFTTIITEIPILILSKEGLSNISFIGIAGATVNWMRYVGVWIIIYFMYKILQQNASIQQEKLQLENLAKTTELELLKMQLNPHFLFNALNSIKALVILNPDKSREAIVQLSELLRFTLQYGKEKFIPVQHEISEVKKYLHLEQMRFEERLEVRFEVAAEVHHKMVPPAILLTLVENAIKHGVAKHMGVNTIQVNVTLVNDAVLQLTVLNSGVYQPAGASHGIGLKHIQKRLEELYGKQAIFTITQQQQVVAATLQLPIL